MKVLIYARCSHPDQAEKDLSIPAQLRELREYAKNNNHEVFTELVDEGISGSTVDRPGFQRMMELGRKKLFEAVLVWRFSRFSRNADEAGHCRMLLRRLGIRVISINEKTEDTATGQFMERIFAAVDQLYIDVLSSDIKRGLKEAAMRGYFAGGTCPFGYKKVKKRDGETERSLLEPDPVTVPIVQRVFEMYVSGISAKKIAQILNAEGIKSPNGKSWRFTTAYFMLRNEGYTGTLVWGKQTRHHGKLSRGKPENYLRIENHHPAIIDPVLFARANAILSDRGAKLIHPRNVSSPYLLTSVLWCGACGSKMTGVSCGRGAYRYYTCKVRRKQGEAICGSNWIKIEALQDLVINEAKFKIFTQANLKQLIATHNKFSGREKTGLQARIASVGKQIQTITQKRDRLYEALENSTFTIDDLAPRIRDHSLRIESLEASRRGLQQELLNVKPLVLDIAIITRYAREIDRILKTKTLEEQKLFFRSFIQRIDVKWPSVTIHYTLPETNIPASTLDRSPMVQDAPESQHIGRRIFTAEVTARV